MSEPGAPKEAVVKVKEASRYGVEKRTRQNRVVKAAIKTHVTKALKLIADKDAAAADAVKASVSALDKAATKKVLHPNAAARRKSRLVKKLNKAAAAPAAAPAKAPAKAPKAAKA